MIAMKVCKNCGTELSDLYCGHCGQKAKVERITLLFIWHEIVHFFTHIEKGFFFTTGSMLIRPGSTAKNFIEGRRKHYQQPVSYILIWAAIYILFLYWLEKWFGENVAINYKEYFGPQATTKFAISHLSILLAILIPFQALYLWLLVTKKKYNYVETAIAVIYSLGTLIMLQFVFAVIVFIIHIISGASVDLQYSDALKVLFLIWFITDFVKLYPVKMKLLRAIGFVILAFGTFTLWRLYGVPRVAGWFM